MTAHFSTLPHAQGTIQPTDTHHDRLEEITERISSGEFHSDADALIPVICIDGRPGGFHLLPNAAGGTESLFVGLDLTKDDDESHGHPTAAGYAAVLDTVVEKGGLVGGHDDNHRSGDGSGCGANDKLPLIYAFIAEHGNVIRAVAESLGVSVSDQVHERIVRAASSRTTFSTGAEMLTILSSYGEDAVVEHLEDAHNEVVAVINTRPGTTLDRRRLQAEFGSDYQAFNVDVWAFEEAARLVAEQDNDVEALVAAMVYYNLATAHVLVGPGLRVVVLS